MAVRKRTRTRAKNRTRNHMNLFLVLAVGFLAISLFSQTTFLNANLIPLNGPGGFFTGTSDKDNTDTPSGCECPVVSDPATGHDTCPFLNGKGCKGPEGTGGCWNPITSGTAIEPGLNVYYNCVYGQKVACGCDDSGLSEEQKKAGWSVVCEKTSSAACDQARCKVRSPDGKSSFNGKKCDNA